MKKPELTDEDKEILERLRKAKAEAQRKAAEKAAAQPAAPAEGTLAEKWADADAAQDEDEGFPQPVPAGVPLGVVVLDGKDGFALYRDSRATFSAVVPGHPRLEGPAEGMEARLVLRELPVEIGFRLGDGPHAEGDAVFQREGQTMTIRRRRDPDLVDDATWATIDSAILVSVVWGTPRGDIPRTIPEPGLPLRWKGDPATHDAAAARALLAIAGGLTPAAPITEEQRAAAAAELGAQAGLARDLATVYDLRALAAALLLS